MIQCSREPVRPGLRARDAGGRPRPPGGGGGAAGFGGPPRRPGGPGGADRGNGGEPAGAQG
ncbi:hypothetical protein EJ594_20165, partial [Pseudomonas aeruginosa]